MPDFSIITTLVTFKVMKCNIFFQTHTFGCPCCVVLYVCASSGCQTAQRRLRSCQGTSEGRRTGLHPVSPTPQSCPTYSAGVSGRRLKKIRKVECSRWEDNTKITQTGMDEFRPTKRGGEKTSLIFTSFSRLLRWQWDGGLWENSKPEKKVLTGQWQQGENEWWDERMEKIKARSPSHCMLFSFYRN